MSLETNRVKFGEFLFDAKERVLLRQGKAVSITPKAFGLLLVLIENHGRLVEKNDLMKAVWAGSFVEEGNLTYTMRLLRIALGDEKRKPRFIETVSRRGYRFIHEVEEIFERVEPPNDTTQTSFQKNDFTANDSPKSKIIFISIAAFVILLVGAIAIGSWYERNGNLASDAPVLSAPFASEKLSTNGKVLHAVVSPDGKNVVYTNGIEGKQSVWLRQLESSNNVEIIPPSDDFYDGLAFSPNGNFLYFARRPRPTGEPRSIYRVSIFGGVPAKIISETEGWMSISPDGNKISFIRCPERDDEYCSLWIADSDGENERKLVSRPRPLRIGDNKISPDGKTIVFAVGQSQNQANEFGLSEVNIETGAERELTTQKFFDIRNLAWLPDKSSLLIAASKIPNKHFRIWQVFTATGDIQPLTKDSESYSDLSLDSEAKVLISTQVKEDFRLAALNRGNLSNPQNLADASNVTFAPNGKIIFSSTMSGNDEIWSINADGSGQRQLTNDAADDRIPVVSSAGNLVFFASNRTGETQVWRMNADGSNQTQITDKEGGYPIFVSPDGKWLYYHHGLDKTLWRASTMGGEEQLVLNKRTHYFAFSPDGLQIAFLETQGEDKIIEVISLIDGQIVKTFKIANQKPAQSEIAWMPDGKGIVYISAETVENYILQLQPSDGGTPQKIADLGNERINSFAVAPDGKSFAIVQGGWRHDAVLLRGLK